MVRIVVRTAGSGECTTSSVRAQTSLQGRSVVSGIAHKAALLVQSGPDVGDAADSGIAGLAGAPVAFKVSAAAEEARVAIGAEQSGIQGQHVLGQSLPDLPDRAVRTVRCSDPRAVSAKPQ
ncbi:hypothetical protein [Streptomyces sp. NPDC041003]|uniref:hypothetical protein n=1 Tax=Streptomyces sp. NPDC041003 TaxID=3155730 RepID=UPI0033EA859B